MITAEDLGVALDAVCPFDLPGCHTTIDEGEVWCAHPDWIGVVCKIGAVPSGPNAGRVLVIWQWLDERNPAAPVVVVLTVREATPRELHLIAEILAASADT